MLISRMPEGEVEGRGGEYRTADELFELMAKDHHYDTSDNQPLSTRDLIILYKNIDVGTKLMSSANVGQRKAPNQHVETVVYKDERESDDSDVSEIYSNEEIQDVFSINNERIDLINNLSSMQHPLCHKFGNIEFQSSNFSEYDSHFLFKDPYIKQQLKNINILPDSTEFDTALPATLLDYICCKRLEDNNFYMDNVIRYVQHTIEQLKRISNGDYLTDRAKEKWREVSKDLIIPNSECSKVLATSVSIPIHVMGKVDGHISTWDDIVHSEVDVRSLSKILEKKIIIEVPKLINGSYRLFSERCTDNLIISCKKDFEHDSQKKEESRVDVIFQLKPSGSGHVLRNINSIMILEKCITTPEQTDQQAAIPLGNSDEVFEEGPKIVEIDGEEPQDQREELKPAKELKAAEELKPVDNEHNTSNITKSVSDTSDSSANDNLSSILNAIDKQPLKKKVCIKTLKIETDFSVISPHELRCAIQRLNMQTPVPEESEESCVSKKKSPTRVRIKSPYENQSYSIEEKKRRKLLEVREKREKKKMALSENCKVKKHKYGKSIVLAQPSSSITKLSITNKSFYNSIYGEHANQEDAISKKYRNSQSASYNLDEDLKKDEHGNASNRSSLTALGKSSFDDGTTETIMQLQRKLDTETFSTPISEMTDIHSAEVSLLSHLIGASEIDCNTDDYTHPVRMTKRDDEYTQEVDECDKDDEYTPEVDERDKDDEYKQVVVERDIDMTNRGTYTDIIVPTNTPKMRDSPNKSSDESKKITTPVECRKSIDKIYDLLKKIGKYDDSTISSPATQHSGNNTDDLNMDGGRSTTTQVTDSGTSVKHQGISSNPSTFSLEKKNNLNTTQKDKKKKVPASTVLPKVIISTKLPNLKIDNEWNKSDRKRVITSPSPKVADNPLKAISQLLHEFNNVQKTRHKIHKKDSEAPIDSQKTVSRQGSSKKPRQETSSKDIGLAGLKPLWYKDRKSRPGPRPDSAHFTPQFMYVDDKRAGKSSKKNLSDIIDEAKEARGEAVRGPPKQYSRINTLAQPKKSYVQAHNDEYQNKYGRNTTAHRVNRTITSAPLVEKNTVNMNAARNKRKGPDIPVSPSKGISAVPPLERSIRPRRSASNSPARMRMPSQSTNEASFRQITAPKSPDLKKKMVEVESYVKSHYGHKPIDTSEFMGHEVHKSRVPLVPNDIELGSLSSPIGEESTALGNQLHFMVDTMINTMESPILGRTECQESASKLGDGLENLMTTSLLRMDERKSESDYPVDIFEDKNILTAVASIPKDKLREDKVADENIDTIDTYDVQRFSSATELRKLENALYQRISVGSFPKRLRIKNLTLTPKQSLHQVIVVQSGDAGSLLVKSSLSQSLITNSKTNSLTALQPLDRFNINRGLTNIPMQVATIGYTFPKYHCTQMNTLGRSVQAIIEKPSYEDVYCKSHKTSQCFKGLHTESCLEQATQANMVLSITSDYNMNIVNSKESVEINNSKNIPPITTICERIRLISEKFEGQQPVIERPQRSYLRTEKNNTTQIEIETCQNVQQSKVIKPILDQNENIQPTKEKDQEDKIKDMSISNTSLNICKDLNEGEIERKPSEKIDHSTSLDILVGLLNEIRKITGEAIDINEQGHNCQSKELEVILNKAATNESAVDNSCRDLVSVSSFHKLNQLDSNLSTSSFNMLKNSQETVIKDDNKGCIEILEHSNIASVKPKNVDKEVTVNIEKQYVNKLTDVPSCFFPFTISDGNNISDSVVEILSEPSTLSVYSFAKYDVLTYKTCSDRMLEENNENKILAEKNTREAGCFNIFNNKEDEKISDDSAKGDTNAVSRYKRRSKVLTSTSCVAMGSSLDPLLKMKRDILVTVYSILVFTVFAALSFPKLFFHVEM